MIRVDVPVRMPPQRFMRAWRQHERSVEQFVLSAETYLDVTSTTLSSVTAQNVDAGLTISGVATSSPTWSAKISAQTCGEYTFETAVAFSDGTTQVLEYCVEVVDP